MDISQISKLANLALTPSQSDQLKTSFDQVLQLVSHIQELDTTGVNPTSQVTGLENITRADEIDHTRVLSQSEALSGTTQTSHGYFQVKAVFSDQ